MNKKHLVFILVLILILVGFFLYRSDISNVPEPLEDDVSEIDSEEESEITNLDEEESIPDIEVVADNLEIPWDIAFLPDGDLLVTERPGRLVRVNFEDDSFVISEISVEHVGEGGLLGIALHPDFEDNNLLYLYRTVSSDSDISYINQIDQYRLEENSLVQTDSGFNFINRIPGARYHDGGRLAFGPDDKLYVTVGDATNSSWAQIYNSENSLQNLAGSILRLNPDGSVPEDNPFDNYVWSYGHRNPQGLSWDDEGRLWSTEHGRSGVLSGYDEINLIEPGNNYGWPDSQGSTVEEGTVGPIEHSGSSTTWAPASALYWDGSLFFGGLRGEALYEAVLDEEDVIEVKKHFKGEFGRIRTVDLSPDGMFYITTSNRDGRGTVQDGDDKVIRLNPNQFRE